MSYRNRLYFLSLFALSIAFTACSHRNDDRMFLLVGTYTSEDSHGIYVYRFDQKQGTAEYVSDVKSENPSYIAVSPDERSVYAVNENGRHSTVSAFAFDRRRGVLIPRNVVPTAGIDPCYISIDPQQRFAATANYSSGTVNIFPLKADGSLEQAKIDYTFSGSGPDTIRQRMAHLHCVVFTPDSHYMMACDLGSDRIYSFKMPRHNEAVLYLAAPITVEPAGTGPRHLTFSPNGRYAYLIGELSGEVIAFRYNDGKLEAFQHIAADTTAGSGGKGSADIHVSPDGRFLYASNRLKADGIAIFRISESDGSLTFAGYQPTGLHPRNFIITPNGKFLLSANRNSNNIQIFSIDPMSGLLSDTGRDIKVSQAVCLKFLYTD